MAETVRWGILGAANFARQHMAPAIHLAENAVLAGLATSSPEKAAPFQALAPNLRVFDSYDKLLTHPGIDAVYVPLPNHLHVKWAKRALAAGNAVLVEKPIAMQESEFDELIAARDASGLVTAEAFMIVHHPQWQRAREVLAEGVLGKLTHVDAMFCYNNAAAPDNIRNRPETGGGRCATSASISLADQGSSPGKSLTRSTRGSSRKTAWTSSAMSRPISRPFVTTASCRCGWPRRNGSASTATRARCT